MNFSMHMCSAQLILKKTSLRHVIVQLKDGVTEREKEWEKALKLGKKGRRGDHKTFWT